MGVRERCSCGAKFETDEPNPMKLVREWRKEHTCLEQESSDIQAIHGGTAQIEQPIGFTIEGLDYPARRHDPWDE